MIRRSKKQKIYEQGINEGIIEGIEAFKKYLLKSTPDGNEGYRDDLKESARILTKVFKDAPLTLDE